MTDGFLGISSEHFKVAIIGLMLTALKIKTLNPWVMT